MRERRRKIVMTPVKRAVPRPCTMHWGTGQVVEEAAYVGRYHEPSLQLIAFEDGSQAIRLCYYTRGRFQRNPLMLDTRELGVMRRALSRTPQLRKLLRTLAG